MSFAVKHEHTRVPVTALASCGPLLLAAEGPLLRVFHGATDYRLLATRRLFEAQVIHGITVYAGDTGGKLVAIWGGCLIRFFTVRSECLNGEIDASVVDEFDFSSPIRVLDWILDLSFGPCHALDSSGSTVVVCAAVTAHDALLELTVKHSDGAGEVHAPPLITASELTSSTRSILYSAHVLWDSPDCILVAAGTAFGEILYWSWTRGQDSGPTSQTHNVFLGHEGSIFGVQISKELEDPSTRIQRRYLASCSDDRTIRLWDISSKAPEGEPGTQRTRHTGFGNATDGTDRSSSACIAIGWGHISRVWNVQFLDCKCPGAIVSLLSSGEDATSRIWNLVQKPPRPTSKQALTHDLHLVSTGAYHNGKNIWSTAVADPLHEHPRVACGGADSKITVYPFRSSSWASGQKNDTSTEYTVQDVAQLSSLSKSVAEPIQNTSAHRSSKASEFFRSYAFMSRDTFLLTTNTGKVYVEQLSSKPQLDTAGALSRSVFIAELEDLRGYSVCSSDSALEVAFVAGTRGNIYMYRNDSKTLSKLCTVNGKVGSIFVSAQTTTTGSVQMLATVLGQQMALFSYLDITNDEQPVVRVVSIPVSELQTGNTITSMAYVSFNDGFDYILIGFRTGSIAIYSIPDTPEHAVASLVRAVPNVHGKETVTSMMWIPSKERSIAHGHLASTGRNGCIAVHAVDLTTNNVSMVHNLLLPIGPNIEGLYCRNEHLMVFGFSSTTFVHYDTTDEKECMSVETGGSHRSWAFNSHTSQDGEGTLVWTRASNMHVKSQNGADHRIIRSGGHGREIKAVATTLSTGLRSSEQLIATGAEDTDIKLFEYKDGDFIYRQTLRKHTTGIQHLHWSEDGKYLFSSGGCEEFYIWRICVLPSFLGIGVVCESVCIPESEHSDLRIMSFDVKKMSSSADYMISMVYSDSKMRVYSYDPTAVTKWQTLAIGTYFTSCLTQSVILSPTTILTAGTDGHAVTWPLLCSIHRQHDSTAHDPSPLNWHHPTRIHQNASKTLATQALSSSFSPSTSLLVSGGDDGSLTFLVATPTTDPLSKSSYAQPPLTYTNAHASAITTCAVLKHENRSLFDHIFIMTSGNDQWVRIWELKVLSNPDRQFHGIVDAKRIRRVKSNVADVSSMAVLSSSAKETKVLLCGVGMEVLRVDWDDDVRFSLDGLGTFGASNVPSRVRT